MISFPLLSSCSVRERSFLPPGLSDSRGIAALTQPAVCTTTLSPAPLCSPPAYMTGAIVCHVRPCSHFTWDYPLQSHVPGSWLCLKAPWQVAQHVMPFSCQSYNGNSISAHRVGPSAGFVRMCCSVICCVVWACTELICAVLCWSHYAHPVL